MRSWVTVPIPLISGGEDTASAPTASQRPSRVENVLITGTNVVQQMPDWLATDTLDNATPTENNAVCGIYPFATQGGASGPSAGVALSFNTADNAIYLHQMGEDHVVMRSLTAYASYAEAAPPQTTAFEMFGKFYFCEDGREAAASRLGMAVFDPVASPITAASAANPTVISAAYTPLRNGDSVLISGMADSNNDAAVNAVHTISGVVAGVSFTIPVDLTGGAGTTATFCVVHHPTYDLVSGGAAAAALRFRGIAKHRGGTILGWGYGDEETGNIDAPHMLRFCEYVTPDTWVAATDQRPTTAGRFVVGTLDLPVVACATSGQYTIVGKATEVFALDGDYSAQFYLRQIGTAHGPLSTTGMVSIGGAAVWMSAEGPAASVNGGPVQLLAIDRATRRLLTYFDLTYAWAVHDNPRTRVGWLLRRSVTLDGTAKTTNWGDEVFWWDYERNIFYVTQTPTTCFSIGMTDGPGTSLAGPGAAPAATAETVGSDWFTPTWTAGDTSAQTYLEYKENVDAVWTVVGPLGPGVVTATNTGLVASTLYDWRVRHFKNGAYSAYATDSFTTLASGSVTDPTNFAYAGGGSQVVGGKTYWTVDMTWTRGEYSPLSRVEVWEGTGATFAAASRIMDAISTKTGFSQQRLESSTPYYYWVRHVLSDGTTGTEVSLAGDPIQYNSGFLAA